MSGRKRLLLLWQLGESWLGPVGHTTSAEQGPYPSPLQSFLHPPRSPCPGTKRPTGNECQGVCWVCPGSRVLCIPARRSACSLCRETALYGNLILKKGVLAPEDLCQAC